MHVLLETWAESIVRRLPENATLEMHSEDWSRGTVGIRNDMPALLVSLSCVRDSHAHGAESCGDGVQWIIVKLCGEW